MILADNNLAWLALANNIVAWIKIAKNILALLLANILQHTHH